MKKVSFTPLEIVQLRNNPNTYAVTEFSIRFTAQFKMSLARRYLAGESTKDIVESCGYDLEMVGENCIYSLLYRTRKALENGKEICDGPRFQMRNPKCANHPFVSKDKEIATILHELTYLRQEIEFIKKTLMLENTKKRRR
jgi:hypothetical protein